MTPSRPRKKKSSQPSKSTQQLRIIGGRWRGRKLSFASAEGLRPTGDRVRETLFNWLAAELNDSRCLDLFGGSGALGLEALSRGAALTTIIEQNAEAVRQIRSNLSLLGCENAQLIQADTLSHLKTPPVQPYDIAFIDPPFQHNLWSDVIQRLDEYGWLSDRASVYIEAPRQQAITTPHHWHLHREKPVGNVSFQLYRLQAD